MFAFASPLDIFLILVGIASAVGCGSVIPIITVRFVTDDHVFRTKILKTTVPHSDLVTSCKCLWTRRSAERTT